MTSKRRRHTPEQIIRKLAEGHRLQAAGQDLDEVRRTLQITASTWNRWIAQYGGMKASDARRPRELEAENIRLKRIVANQAIDIDMLREVAKGDYDSELRSSAVNEQESRAGPHCVSEIPGRSRTLGTSRR